MFSLVKPSALFLMAISAIGYMLPTHAAINIEDDSGGRGALRWFKLDDFNEPANFPMPAQPYAHDLGELRIFLPVQNQFENRFTQVCKHKKLDFAGRIATFFQLAYNGNTGIRVEDLGSGISSAQNAHFKSGTADLAEIPDQLIVGMSNSPYIFRKNQHVVDRTPMSYVLGIAYLDDDALKEWESHKTLFAPARYLNMRIHQPYVAPTTYREIINTGYVNREFESDYIEIKPASDLRVSRKNGVLNITTRLTKTVTEESEPNQFVLKKLAKPQLANAAIQSAIYVGCR